MLREAAERFLTEATARPPGDELVLTIREFIGKWGALRRGFWWVQEIREDLERHGLTTVPPFEVGYIDNDVRIVRRVDPSEPEAAIGSEPSEAEVEAQADGPALTVSMIESASRGVVRVARDESLAKAQSLMLQSDYSQLAVMTGERNLVGAISWESIAQARMHNSASTVRECVVPAEAVGLDDDLLTLIPRVVSHGFIFVRRADRSVTGIITTADLSEAFLRLAEPFLLVGEAERRLRSLVTSNFSDEQIEAVRDPDDPRAASGAASLTLGEVKRLFESKDRWGGLAWDVDRVVFCDSLERLRVVRNEVMHFSPDPVESSRLGEVRNLVKWLKLFRT